MTEQLGKRIRFLRKSKKLSQKEFGNLFGLAESTIGMYERDERRPDYELLSKFADYFGVSTDYLLGRTDIPDPTPHKEVDKEFQSFINDPELQLWYKELPQSDEEELRKLRTIWEMIKKDK
ncbi:helix-turn-helix domain-containing protein [Ureibacillus thermosphaericus]|uniref:Transcriptional regulator with XRE-family HTH domain n=1 Tax=Ureibacillus thermosphaericus TaxID=51173 RepID=A0A840Q0M1_URETH|nr:helix-turn-helix transcriptional regulator [Ureibacillus thermosphaericus]MBB5148616.1 transcriptional regulator with XRE-family HTH domain [Ureibacillus thermosphaericus]NKZ31333.1 helix-turn-helix transcriptional regulator [Ureibacillus thermosphaericus]